MFVFNVAGTTSTSAIVQVKLGVAYEACKTAKEEICEPGATALSETQSNITDQVQGC